MPSKQQKTKAADGILVEEVGTVVMLFDAGGLEFVDRRSLLYSNRAMAG
jgi:hypothetical protein